MKKFIALVMATAVVVVAHAEESKTYWGGEFGLTKLDDATGTMTGALVSSVGGAATATQDSTVPTFKILGGYRYTENLDFEIAYFQSGTAQLNFNGVSSGSVAYTGNANLKFSGIEYAANLRPNVATGMHDFYLRLGGHRSKTKTNFSITANAVSAGSGESYSGTGTLYGLGYDRKVNETTKVRFSAMKYSKVGGESDSGGTVYSIGFLQDF